MLHYLQHESRRCLIQYAAAIQTLLIFVSGNQESCVEFYFEQVQLTEQILLCTLFWGFRDICHNILPHNIEHKDLKLTTVVVWLVVYRVANNAVNFLNL